MKRKQIWNKLLLTTIKKISDDRAINEEATPPKITTGL